MNDPFQPTSHLIPYLPRVVRVWSEQPHAPRARILDGTLVSADISGFTALAERLQAKGKAGAEELVTRISGVFEQLIAAAERHGGDVLKFRGDALLLFFVGYRHPERACGAASDMQWTIEEIGVQETSLGTVELRMSVGVHSAPCHLFLTETPHRELLVAGPAATRVFELEDLASAGEIVVSAETAVHVDPAWLGPEKESGRLMGRLEPGASTVPPVAAVPGHALHEYVPQPLRDHLAVARGEAEHRQVTVAFLKLSGTDTTLAAEGPEELLARIDRVAHATGRACGTYGITWLESDIDVDAVKLYLTAGAPATSGDDEEGMLRALRDVLAACPELELRAGVNRGHVFTGEIGARTRRTYAVMGDTVNLAARLCGKAGAGEILTTAPVLDRARTLYDTAPRALRVKGKALEIAAHALGAPLGRRNAEEAATGALRGREVEVEALREALNRARGGSQQVVELIGPPGIGKSRLVAELRGLAVDHGFEVLHAATEPYSTAEPYGVFRDLLRRVAGIPADRPRDEAGADLEAVVRDAVPELVPWLPLLAIPFDAAVAQTAEASALEPEQSRTRVHQTVEAFLDCLLANPTLIVVEDAHWLDDASEYLLRHLVDRPGARPWLCCVTTRPGVDPFAGSHHLHATSLELRPLPDAVAADLTLELADEYALSRDDVERLVARAGGNPLFVRELVAAARSGQRVETLPDTVESLLTTRIDTLHPADRILLRYAAVVGSAFDLPLLADVLAAEVPGADRRDRWRPLDEFLLDRPDGTIAFRHDLVRATAYEGLSFRRRREIHGRVGLALEERAGERADEEAALLSLHFLEAEDFDRAWRYAAKAGERAQAGFANVVAAELYERALSAADRQQHVPPTEVAGVAERLGDVCELCGRYDQATVGYDRARAVSADDPVAHVRLARKQGAVLERQGAYADASAWLRGILDSLDADALGPDAHGELAELELEYAVVLYRQGSYEECGRWSAQAAARAEESGDLRALAHAYRLLDSADRALGGLDGGWLEKALPLYEELGDQLGKAITLNNMGVRAYYAGRWDDALRFYAESRDAEHQAGDVVRAATASNNEAEILLDQGRVGEALPLFQEALRVYRASGYAFGAAVVTMNLARCAAAEARFSEADALFAKARAELSAIGADSFVLETGMRQAECLLWQGRPEEALALAAETIERSREAGELVPREATLERIRGLAFVRLGDEQAALHHLRAASTAAETAQNEFETALALHSLAAMGGDGEGDAAVRAGSILARLGVIELPSVADVPVA